MRAPEHAIPAPPFPRELPWINVAPLRMDKQRGRPVLVEFWDFCRVNSLRTLPYLEAWHERYARRRAARDRRPHRRLPARARHRDAVARRGRAARHRVPRRGRRAARDLGLLRQRGLARALPVGPRRARSTRSTTARAPTRRPSARSRRCSASSARCSSRCAPRTPRASCCPAQTEDQPGAYSGPYEAGGVWAVLEGGGEVRGERAHVARRRARAATRSSSTRTTRPACSTSRSAPA